MFVPENLVVMKFGGTSMGSPEAMRSASAIVRAHRGQVIVVVSAVSGTTDALIALGRTALRGGDWREALDQLSTRHEVLAAELGMSLGLSKFWSEIQQICQGVEMLGELSPAVLDRLQGFGERMSATIFAAQLRADVARAEMVDAFRLVATDNQFGSANVNFVTTNARMREVLSPLLADGMIPVVTGFIGQSVSGLYTTLGRGGSDYSGAIVAAGMDAVELQVWKEVDGMFMADPRLVPEATVLSHLSFAEASELAYFGAKALHPLTIKPAVEKKIPVRMLNTFRPEALGTLITSEVQPSLKSVTSKKGLTVITVESLGMLGASGFLATVFDVFRRHNVVVDVLASSEVSVSVTVDREVPEALVEDLRAFAAIDVQPDKSIVCLVGDGIQTDLDVIWKLFYSVRSMPIRMISQGASQRNITFVVAESDANTAVRNIFEAFFTPTV